MNLQVGSDLRNLENNRESFVEYVLNDVILFNNCITFSGIKRVNFAFYKFIHIFNIPKK